MKNYFLVTFFIFLFLVVSPVSLSYGEDGVKEGGVRKYGVIQNVAPDRQFERIGGKYEPEGLDIYIRRLFDDVFLRVEGIEAKLDNLKKQVDQVQKQVDQTRLDIAGSCKEEESEKKKS